MEEERERGIGEGRERNRAWDSESCEVDQREGLGRQGLEPGVVKVVRLIRGRGLGRQGLDPGVVKVVRLRKNFVISLNTFPITVVRHMNHAYLLEEFNHDKMIRTKDNKTYAE